MPTLPSILLNPCACGPAEQDYFSFTMVEVRMRLGGAPNFLGAVDSNNAYNVGCILYQHQVDADAWTSDAPSSGSVVSTGDYDAFTGGWNTTTVGTLPNWLTRGLYDQVVEELVTTTQFNATILDDPYFYGGTISTVLTVPRTWGDVQSAVNAKVAGIDYPETVSMGFSAIYAITAAEWANPQPVFVNSGQGQYYVAMRFIEPDIAAGGWAFDGWCRVIKSRLFHPTVQRYRVDVFEWGNPVPVGTSEEDVVGERLWEAPSVHGYTTITQI